MCFHAVYPSSFILRIVNLYNKYVNAQIGMAGSQEQEASRNVAMLGGRLQLGSMIVRTQEWKILLYNVLPPYSKYMSSWALGLFSQKNIVESRLDTIAPSVPVLQHESLLNHVSSVHAHLARRPLHVCLLHLPSMLPKKCISKGIRTLPTGLKTRPPNKSSYK